MIVSSGSVDDAGVDVASGPDPLQLHVAPGVRSVPPAVVAGVDADVRLVATLTHEHQVAATQPRRADVHEPVVLRDGVLGQPLPEGVAEHPLHVSRAVERARPGRTPDIGLAALRASDPQHQPDLLASGQPQGVATYGVAVAGNDVTRMPRDRAGLRRVPDRSVVSGADEERPGTPS